jgi:DNA-binding GntR family transcriptional regulator
MVAARSLLRQWIERATKRPRGQGLANEHHRRIVSAIEAHDENAADEAMRVHVETIGRLIMEGAFDVRPARAGNA